MGLLEDFGISNVHELFDFVAFQKSNTEFFLFLDQSSTSYFLIKNMSFMPVLCYISWRLYFVFNYIYVKGKKYTRGFPLPISLREMLCKSIA